MAIGTLLSPWYLWFYDGKNMLSGWCADYLYFSPIKHKNIDFSVLRWIINREFIDDIQNEHLKFSLLDTKEFGYYYETPKGEPYYGLRGCS